MKLSHLLWMIIIAGMLLMFACKTTTDPDPEDTMITLTGIVSDEVSNRPIENAVIRVLNYSPETTAITDINGAYSLELTVKESRELNLTAFKETFLQDTVAVLATPGRDVSVPLFSLTPTISTPVASGSAASLYLFSQSAPFIGVKESGSAESAQLVFEVVDSSGIPLDLTNKVNVRFRLGASPAGAYLNPSTATTGSNGKVDTQIFSGTVAGTAQIVAEIDINGAVIRSQPVAMTIHGGLPDDTHFSIAVERLNFPGYNLFGLTNRITAFVGDKYSNPVRPNTAVYYESTGGIIEGSAQTDLQGRASVDLISAAPQPIHPVLGAGFATVTASTIDENEATITSGGVVLFSGVPFISISPTTFILDSLSSQSFVYTVSDQNNNPLAAGTSISVGVSGEGIRTLGRTSYTLPDTQSRSWTTFSFTLQNEPDSTSITGRPVVVDISTTGPNGAAFISISGIAF